MNKAILPRPSKKMPYKTTAGYKAAELIHAGGALSREELFRVIVFSIHGRNQRCLQHYIDIGWFVETDGKINVCAQARSHFDSLQQEDNCENPVLQIVPRRQINVLNRPAISGKYLLNPRGSRDDIPAWSNRSGDFHLKSANGKFA